MPDDLNEGGSQDAGGQIDSGAGDDSQALDNSGADNSGADNSDAGGTTDWRVEKYGHEWENSAAYWKDNSNYAWNQYKTEKQKRQQGAKGLDHEDQPAKQDAAAAKVNKDPAQIETAEQLLAEARRQAAEEMSQTLTQRERAQEWKNSIRQARESFAGGEGLPSFADVEQEVLMPLLQQSPKIGQLLRELENPGQAAYTLGIVLKAKTPEGLRKMFASQGYEELTDKIDRVSKEAVRVRGNKGGPTNGKLTEKDIWGMSSAEFAKLEAKNTGRTT
jgi:hypothetical protein